MDMITQSVKIFFNKINTHGHIIRRFMPQVLKLPVLQTYWNELEVEKLFVPVEHHRAHAASVFYPSTYKQALFWWLDRVGETNSISLFYWQRQSTAIIKKL